LANPPFMSPKGGIRPHKRFSVQSNRSEVLFVDYIAEHLTQDGRAAVIVPEGIIFQSGNAYKQLRKMLVEKYLVGVISLPAGVFNPYSGVKTSILWLDKSLAKKTDKILFVKIENDGFDLGAQRRAIKGNDLPFVFKKMTTYRDDLLDSEVVDFETEKQLTLIAKTDISENGEYNLSAERYKVLVLKSSIFPIVELGDYIQIDNGRVLTEFDEFGTIACVKVSDMNLPQNATEIITSSHWIKTTLFKLLPVNSVIFPKRGAAIATNKKRLTRIPCLIDNNCMGITVTDDNVLNPKYLFEFMRQFDLTSISNSAGIALINNPDIKGVKIPLPPLSVQEEIVAEIEGYRKLMADFKEKIVDLEQKIKDRIAKVWGE